MYLTNLFSGRKCQVIINAYCIVASAFLFYFCFTYGPRQHEYKLNSDVLSQTSHKTLDDNPNELSVSAQLTVYKHDSKDCQKRANLRTQPHASLPMCIYDPAKDLEISATIHRSGEWDPASIRTIKYIFQQEIRFNGTVAKEIKGGRIIVPKGDRSADYVRDAEYTVEEQPLSMLDLGCNIGAFTLTIASMGHQVLAVDAMEESLQLLATSLSMNNLTSLVTLVNNAVSDRRGQVYLEINAKNRGGSFIKQDRPSSNISTLNQSRKLVSAICLEDLVPYVRTGRVFLKMDIESFESKALDCAAKFFNAVDVPYVFMEWVFHRHNFNGAHIIDFLTRRNFVPYQHPQSAKSLELGSYASWPDNVFWIREK